MGKTEMDILKAETKICMITDSDYIYPTLVAVYSMIASKKAEDIYTFHIIVNNPDEKDKSRLERFNSESVHVKIIDGNIGDMVNIHHDNGKNICAASPAALLKMMIPDLLPDEEKVLYLDGDIIVKSSLSEIYDTDIDGKYAAVVPDSGCIYFKHEYSQMVEKYFNSGVMLLNLKELRSDRVCEKLLQTKDSLNDYFMDQNAFNIVFDKKVIYLPIKYNFLCTNLVKAENKWSLDDINKLFGTSYKTQNELLSDVAVFHYSSKSKPWNEEVPFGYEWKSIERKYNKSLSDAAETGAILSIIIPCYNVEEYIFQTIKSIIAQDEEKVEIICIDDGSTDSTNSVLCSLQERYPNITIISDSNHGQGYQRNIGIKKAHGKYIMFMDADDILENGCFSRVINLLESLEADGVYFDAYSFYESKELEEEHPQYKNMYRRRKWYPYILSGKEMYAQMRNNQEYFVMPCLNVIRKEFLADKKIDFPSVKLLEDNLFSFRLINSVEKAVCIPDVLYSRRVRGNSTMTRVYEERAIDECRVLIYTIKQMYGDYELLDPDDVSKEAVINHIKSYCEQLSMTFAGISQSMKESFLSDISENDRQLIFFSDYVSKSENSFRYYRNQIKKFENETKYKELEKKYMALKNETDNEKEMSKTHNEAAVNNGFSDMEQYYRYCLDETRKSFSYKIGLFITFIPRKIRALFTGKS